jgi:hypothetical protein
LPAEFSTHKYCRSLETFPRLNTSTLF